jgi:hypothetical protein
MYFRNQNLFAWITLESGFVATRWQCPPSGCRPMTCWRFGPQRQWSVMERLKLDRSGTKLNYILIIRWYDRTRAEMCSDISGRLTIWCQAVQRTMYTSMHAWRWVADQASMCTQIGIHGGTVCCWVRTNRHAWVQKQVTALAGSARARRLIRCCCTLASV